MVPAASGTKTRGPPWCPYPFRKQPLTAENLVIGISRTAAAGRQTITLNPLGKKPKSCIRTPINREQRMVDL